MNFFIRLSLFLGLLILAFSASGLFVFKHSVQELNRKLKIINHNITKEQENIHVLNAEWAYLTQPQNLSKLSKKYLHLEQIEPYHIIRLVEEAVDDTE